MRFEMMYFSITVVNSPDILHAAAKKCIHCHAIKQKFYYHMNMNEKQCCIV